MCDTIAVVGDGEVLFAKNSDRDPNEAQLLDWCPRRDHAPQSQVRCTYLTIPQVEKTWAVLLSRPFWMWGAEIGANEHGVVIGNEAVFTRQPYSATGLTGMDLVRLGLERARSARGALDCIVALLEEHGQGGGCGHEDRGFTYHNAFLIADWEGAFVLETAGSQWAVEEVHGPRCISNRLSIPGFAKAHSDLLKTWASSAKERQARTCELAQSVEGPGDLFRLLRDHGPTGDTPHYSWFNGGLSAPCVHAGGLLANSQTTASWVAQLTPGGARHWVTGTAAPCTGLFKPVSVLDPLDVGSAGTDRADSGGIWWRHEVLHRSVLRDPAQQLPHYVGERDRVEQRWLQEPPSSAEAFAEADELLATWIERVGPDPPDVRPIWSRRYWSVRNRRARAHSGHRMS